MCKNNKKKLNQSLGNTSVAPKVEWTDGRTFKKFKCTA